MADKKYNDVVVLGNGSFPNHPKTLKKLNDASFIVCCDGAVERLVSFGKQPDIIVGDMDSINDSLMREYAAILCKQEEQETNDLTKSINWCVSKGIKKVIILGATGRREDHTLGNISLLLDYIQIINVVMYSNTGIFTPVTESRLFESYPGQQVSIFSLQPETELSSENLKYPLNGLKLSSWWRGTLNESQSDFFHLNFTSGKVIVYQEF